MIRNIEIQKDTFHLDNHRRTMERPEVVTDRGGEGELSRAYLIFVNRAFDVPLPAPFQYPRLRKGNR